MASLNKVILIGNLTRDPQLVANSNNGQTFCRFGLAVNRRYRTADGVDHEEVTFVDVTVNGRIGENCARYLAKGRQAYVEGSLKLETWVGRDEKERTSLRVFAERVLFLDSPGLQAAGEQNSSRPVTVKDFMPRPANTAPLPPAAPVPPMPAFAPTAATPPAEVVPPAPPPPMPETTAEPPIDDVPF